MIFVTVGTHEQQFNRLVKYMDSWAAAHDEKVVIQTGYSTYEPAAAEWSKLFPYQKMLELVDEARIVITHGGPSSFIMPLQIGKTPIVVPRQKTFGEHVNDHQVTFCRQVAERMGTIIVVEDVGELGGAIDSYENTASGEDVNNSDCTGCEDNANCCDGTGGSGDTNCCDTETRGDSSMSTGKSKSNNARFCEGLEEIVEELFKGK